MHLIKITPVPSKAVVLLFIVGPIVCEGSVFRLCFFFCFFFSLLCKHLDGEERAGYLTLIVFLMTVE